VRILGIDPGSRVCGYGMVATDGGTVRYVECGVLTAPEHRATELRLGEIARGLTEVLDELRPDVVALEDVFARVNMKSALALAQARGMVLAVVGLRGLMVSSYTAPLVKKAITGRGRAEKEQVARMVAVMVGLRRPPRPDAADALALAVTHAHLAGGASMAAARLVSSRIGRVGSDA
jgi:crossover junction endodeoxyribonuclease RuvC